MPSPFARKTRLASGFVARATFLLARYQCPCTYNTSKTSRTCRKLHGLLLLPVFLLSVFAFSEASQQLPVPRSPQIAFEDGFIRLRRAGTPRPGGEPEPTRLARCDETERARRVRFAIAKIAGRVMHRGSAAQGTHFGLIESAVEASPEMRRMKEKEWIDPDAAEEVAPVASPR